jgi:hypothetical protein
VYKGRKENIMVEIFNDFTTTLAIIGALLAAGIIFEKQLIALEDKLDAWIAEKKQEARK